MLSLKKIVKRVFKHDSWHEENEKYEKKPVEIISMRSKNRYLEYENDKEILYINSPH